MKPSRKVYAQVSPLQDSGALTLFGDRPPGSLLVPILDDYCEPVLRRGAVAVVNVMSRAIITGALFLLQFKNGRLGIFQINQAPPGLTLLESDEPLFIIGPPHRDTHIKLSDGPFLYEELNRVIIGRVIGLLEAK